MLRSVSNEKPERLELNSTFREQRILTDGFISRKKKNDSFKKEAGY